MSPQHIIFIHETENGRQIKKPENIILQLGMRVEWTGKRDVDKM